MSDPTDYSELTVHDFLQCALCHEIMFDPANNWGPQAHCKDTVYIIKTASGMYHSKVLPGQGGFAAADAETRRIRGRLFGISVDDKEIPLASYC